VASYEQVIHIVINRVSWGSYILDPVPARPVPCRSSRQSAGSRTGHGPRLDCLDGSGSGRAQYRGSYGIRFGGPRVLRIHSGSHHISGTCGPGESFPSADPTGRPSGFSVPRRPGGSAARTRFAARPVLWARLCRFYGAKQTSVKHGLGVRLSGCGVRAAALESGQNRGHVLVTDSAFRRPEKVGGRGCGAIRKGGCERLRERPGAA